MSGRRRAGFTIGIVAVALLAAACSNDSSDGGSTGMTVPTWEEVVDDTVDVAREQGASDDQLAVLESGDVTFQQYEAAVGRTVECLRAAGIDVIGDRVTESSGYPEINYSYAASSEGRTDDETDAISQACISAHSQFIEGLYRATPVVQEVIDERFEPFREAVVACLRDNGEDVDDEAPRAVLELHTGAVLQRGGPHCVADSGFNG
ncbi:hypothetical protein [Cellulomonas endometrii]|uniref:hypothetical protein n=1 Tax=Cellulomonas endometrii TaxID=3036301 RepID=UPI0024AD203D|nr:hypothetical protein [Cellulomonas endometrii]